MQVPPERQSASAMHSSSGEQSLPSDDDSDSDVITPVVGSGSMPVVGSGSTPVGHVRVFNRRAIRDLLSSQGFEPITERGAIFPSLPAPMRLIDRIFNHVPSLASNLIVVSARVERSGTKR